MFSSVWFWLFVGCVVCGAGVVVVVGVVGVGWCVFDTLRVCLCVVLYAVVRYLVCVVSCLVCGMYDGVCCGVMLLVFVDGVGCCVLLCVVVLLLVGVRCCCL